MQDTDKIRVARESRGLSQQEVAREIGISQVAYQKIESGKTRKSRYLREVVDFLGLGAKTDEDEVPLIGYVGAGSAAHFYSDAQGPFDMVPAPENATKNTVAVEIRGESLGPLFDRFLCYYDKVQRPVTPDIVGRLCVVGLADGRVLIKRVQRSKTKGLFHLISNTESGVITDVELVWAAPVKQLIPKP